MFFLKTLWSKICFWNRNAKQQEEKTPEKNASEEIAKIYLRNDLVNHKLIPDFIETRIYGWIVDRLLALIHETLEQCRMSAQGQEVSLDVSSMKPVYFLQHLEDTKKKQHFRRIHKSQQESIEYVCQKCISIFIEQLEKEGGSHVTLFPSHFREAIFRNIFRLFVGILQDTLSMTRIRIMFFTFQMVPHPFDATPILQDRSVFRKFVTDRQTYEKARDLSRVVVESDKNIWFIPDIIEKTMYHQAFMFMYFCFYIFVLSSHVSVWNMKIGLNYKNDNS